MNYCPNCGHKLEEGWNYCVFCGERVITTPGYKEEKEKEEKERAGNAELLKEFKVWKEATRKDETVRIVEIPVPYPYPVPSLPINPQPLPWNTPYAPPTWPTVICGSGHAESPKLIGAGNDISSGAGNDIRFGMNA